jgi:hypothetical protein
MIACHQKLIFFRKLKTLNLSLVLSNFEIETDFNLKVRYRVNKLAW